MQPAQERSGHPLGDLRRILGPLAGAAVCVGMAVGSGILRTPGTVANSLPDAAWILAVWGLGALVACLDALILAEMASSFPRVGGLVAYLHLSFGRRVAFLVGWSMLLVTWPASLAAVAVVFGELAVRGASSLEQGGSSVSGQVVGSLVIVLLAGLNLRGLRTGSRVEIGLFVAKVTLLAGVCIAAGIAAAGASAGNSRPAAAPPEMPVEPMLLLGAVGAAMKNVLFTYDGYADAVYMAGETASPGRSLPRALFTALFVIAGLYLLANATFLSVLGVDGLAQSKFAALDVAERAFGDAGERILTAVAMVILLGAINAYFLTGPRIARLLAEERLAFSALGRMNEGGSSRAAMLLVAGAALCYLWTGSFEELLSITVPIIAATVALVAIGLWVQRHRAPSRPRPFRVPAAPLVVLLQVALTVGMVLGFVLDNPRAVAIDAGAVLLGLVCYRFVAAPREAATR